MKKKSLRLIIVIDYDKPQHQANYIIVAEVLRRHADDIIENPNTGETGTRKYEIKTTHGVTKGVISWDMT